MSSTDRPLYEDLLEQRNRLERLANQMIGDFRGVAPLVADTYQQELDDIIVENRKREGLT